MPKVTRDQVAALAGTSTAVVSYVINNGPRPVAPATRERVLAAIERLGYRPDSMAQAMARRRTDLLGMVLPDARQPFFAQLAHAVERVAFDRGKLVLIGNSDYVEAREEHYTHAFLGMRVAGLILISQTGAQQAARAFGQDDRTRVVLLHRRPDATAGPANAAVVTDDVGGARLAVRHLIAHGHRTVACFGRSAATLTAGDPLVERVEGWAQAMREAGLATKGLLVEAPFDRFRTYGPALGVLRRPDRPTAVFCTTDDQALGVLRAARELGLRVPQDLAVAGFDDIAEAAFSDPPLTTVASDTGAMAGAAVSLVLDAPGADGPAADGHAPDPVRVFPARLLTRRSCGCDHPSSPVAPASRR
ncbi:LacI family DNA-binding transcriptional regulator [Kitasatospora sp. NPDC096147]|uniref:LacI family DNA-binding transcriptional regulator n=1 Tax=Kitasatospora sp. NPDC096147 TaxID=3364093 RepID=UPI003808264C